MKIKLLIAVLCSLSFVFSVANFTDSVFAADGKTKKTKTTKPKKKKAKKTKKKSTKKATYTEQSALKSYSKGTKRKPRRSKRKVRGSSSKKKEQEIITTFGGKTRIDFADMLIEGQTKKADTVYLFERTESKIDSLVKVRKDFRKEIMESYLE